MKTVPIVIPFFRENEKLARCLTAIREQTYQPVEVFIRDNTHDNILFTAAVNEGLSKFCFSPEFDFVLVLNQDAYLHRQALELLVSFMAGEPACGIACPVQRSDRGDVTWGGSLESFPFGGHKIDPVSPTDPPFETYWASGACMLLRTATVRELGLLDRNLKFLFSDVDFSLSARARGWKVMAVPAAEVEHGLNASANAGEGNVWLKRVKTRDHLYFLRKWLTGDLYKSLAYEGPALTADQVEQELARSERFLKTLEETGQRGV